MSTIQLIENLRAYVMKQISLMSENNPAINFIKPLLLRMLDKNFDKMDKVLDLIADKDGNVDIENIITEMMDNIVTSKPFVFKTDLLGDIEVGEGQIKVNLPFTDKKLVLNQDDLEMFREMIITKT